MQQFKNFIFRTTIVDGSSVSNVDKQLQDVAYVYLPTVQGVPFDVYASSSLKDVVESFNERKPGGYELPPYSTVSRCMRDQERFEFKTGVTIHLLRFHLSKITGQ